MILRSALIAVLSIISLATFADETMSGNADTEKPSILRPFPEYTDVNGGEKRSFGNPSNNNDYFDHCTSLLRKADSLRGRPQRRKTAMDQYRRQCLGGDKQDRMNKRDDEF